MNLNPSKSSLLAFLLFICFQSFSQHQSKTIPDSYVLQGNFSNEKTAFFKQSIEAADMEQYRLRDATVELVFKNGFKIELMSAKDLTIVKKMQNVNPNNYPSKSNLAPGYRYPVFNIIDSGWIMAEMPAMETKIKKQ